MTKRIILFLTAVFLLLSLCGCDGGEKVNISGFTGNLNPFFSNFQDDITVISLTQGTLIASGTNGEGVILDAYTKGAGLADVTLDGSGKNDVYTVKLGEDIRFSNGDKLTADDVIFSMYVCADPSYDGFCTFCDSGIVGMADYRYGKGASDITVTDAEAEKAVSEMSGELESIVKEKVIGTLLDNEFLWVKSVYGDESFKGTEAEQYAKTYPEPKDLFAFLYSIDKDYDFKSVKDESTVIADVKNQYGTDYETLGTVLGVPLDDMVKGYAKEVILKQKTGGVNVDKISGIEKINDYEIRITAVKDADITKIFGIYIAPLGVYGDKNAYDFANNKFGFEKGKTDGIRNNTDSVGAGAYTVKSYKADKSVTLTANKNYRGKDAPKDKLTFIITGNSKDTGGEYTADPENILLKNIS